MARPANGGTSAVSSSGGITLTAIIARRQSDGALVLLQEKRDGQLAEFELDDSSDRALDLHARLKKSKGEAGRYSQAMCFLRSKTNRRLKFT